MKKILLAGLLFALFFNSNPVKPNGLSLKSLAVFFSLPAAQAEEIDQQIGSAGTVKSFNGDITVIFGRSRQGIVRRAPGSSGMQNMDTSSGISIVSGDGAVLSDTMQYASQIVRNISWPILQNTLGKVPSPLTRVTLYSNPRSYASALLKAGVPGQMLPALAEETGGLTIGSEVWIPLYNLPDGSDLTDALTHELTHVVINQSGVGDKLPTWLNEGIGYYSGTVARKQVDPSGAELRANKLNNQISEAVAQDSLLPLSAGEEDIIGAGYNVEWEDYLAVKYLIDTYGIQLFDNFLYGIARNGIEVSFSSQYNLPLNDFQEQLYNWIMNGEI